MRLFLPFLFSLLLLLLSCSKPSAPLTTDAPRSAPVRIACVGNSITEGHGLADPSTQGYPARMQQLLGDGYLVGNFGLSGYTLMNQTDLPYTHPEREDGRNPYRDALAFAPDIVTIALGTNDSKERYDSLVHTDFTPDLCALIDTFQALPTHPQVYLCLPIPAFACHWTIRDSVIVSEIIPRIQAVASERNLPVIDLYTVMKPFPELLMDAVHPFPAGDMIIAEEIVRRLTLHTVPQ